MNEQEIKLNNIVLTNINSINYVPKFDYECEEKGFNFKEGEGFILKNKNHCFKYPFVKEVFNDIFNIKHVMNKLIKKTNDLSELICLNYKIKDNNIELFDLFNISILKESILINYLNSTILVELEEFKSLNYVDKKLTFKFKNGESEVINQKFNKIFDLELYVYGEKKEYFLQNITIYLDHEIFFMKFIKIINNIISIKLEELEKLNTNKIKIISL